VKEIIENERKRADPSYGRETLCEIIVQSVKFQRTERNSSREKRPRPIRERESSDQKSIYAETKRNLAER